MQHSVLSVTSLLAAFTIAGGCSNDAPPPPEQPSGSVRASSGASGNERADSDNRARIVSALKELSQQTEGDGFATIEVASTKQCVQFTGSASEPLVIDLPRQGASDAEWVRATTFFARLGVAPRSIPGIDSMSFNFECGRDADRAADLAMSIFGEVFQLRDPYDLRITVR